MYSAGKLQLFQIALVQSFLIIRTVCVSCSQTCGHKTHRSNSAPHHKLLAPRPRPTSISHYNPCLPLPLILTAGWELCFMPLEAGAHLVADVKISTLIFLRDNLLTR